MRCVKRAKSCVVSETMIRVGLLPLFGVFSGGFRTQWHVWASQNGPTTLFFGLVA